MFDDDPGILPLLPAGPPDYGRPEKRKSGYSQIEFQIVDELREPDFAETLDYWYVPTYFVNGIKLHEGVPTQEKIRAVFEAALQRGK